MVRRSRHTRLAGAAAVYIDREKTKKESKTHRRNTSRNNNNNNNQPSSKKPIPIQVQILTGRKIRLLVDPGGGDSLLDIKKKIQTKEGIHPDQQILLLHGLRLKDGPVNELRLQPNSCLFLTLRNRGG